MLGIFPFRNDDEDEVSKKELQRRINKAKQDLNETRREMQEHEENYQKLIERGANADGAMRKVYAWQAQFEKVKYSLVKLDSLAQFKDLMELHGHRGKLQTEELRDRVAGRVGATADLPDFELDQFEENLKDARADVEAEIQELQGMTDTMESVASFEDVSMPSSDEEDLMLEVQAGERSAADVNIEEMTDTEEVGADLEFENEDLAGMSGF